MLLLKKITLVWMAAGYITFYNPLGKTLSCPRVMGEAKWKWKWHGKRGGIAHRWLPCGTVVYVKGSNKIVKTKVVDRGPFGAIDTEGKYVVSNPPYLKKYWRKHFAKKGKEPTDEEISKLSRVLPEGWTWRCVADVLYSLKPLLGTKGGRQPGKVSVSKSVWETVKDIRPTNDFYLLPPEKND